ncbi:phage head closure protein [Cupriavidus sp. 2TAF22]|uniref:phage head closure protein n=1 Tax=unclassified Cupriavidus TaxID=2640874 RepID=UPI003F8DF130
MLSEVTILREPGAGELDRRVQIRRRLDLPVGVVDVEQTFPATMPRWAKVVPVSAATYMESAATDSAVTHRVIVRYLDGLTDAHEVVHGDAVYRVKRAAHMNGAKRFTMIEVEELRHG